MGRVSWARFRAGSFHVGFMFLLIVEDLEGSKSRIHILLHWPGVNASGTVRSHELGEFPDLWDVCRLDVVE
jgi:hypothetical protein